jgi:hypothetical protein
MAGRMSKTVDGFPVGEIMIHTNPGYRDAQGELLWVVEIYGDNLKLGRGQLVLTAGALAHLWRMIPRVVHVEVPRQIVDVKVVLEPARQRKKRRKDPELEQHEAIKRGLRGRNTP